MKKLLLTITMLAMALTAQASQRPSTSPAGYNPHAPDTQETRHNEAERYLRAVPLKALCKDMAVNLPPDQRDQFKKLMTSQLDIVGALTKAMIDSMVKHFTTEELKALADFYGSPVGKSAVRKFGAWMTDMGPAFQAEMIKAEAKLNKSHR